MAPGSLSAVYSPLMKRPPLTGCAEKRSWPGDGRGCFLCIGSMIKGRRCFRCPMSTLLGRTLTNIKKHANYAEGVQYAIKSLAEGQYGGACSVIIPKRSTRTCRARSEVKIFPRSWKIMAGLPKQGQECSHPLMPTR